MKYKKKKAQSMYLNDPHADYLVRTQISLPQNLKREIEEKISATDISLSEYIRQAAQAKLQQEKDDYAERVKIANEIFGSLDLSEYPEWSTPERMNKWLREIRSEWDRSDRLDKYWNDVKKLKKSKK